MIWRENLLVRIKLAATASASLNSQSERKERESEMVGPKYDCLANPLGAIRLTFEKAIASGADPASFDGKDWGAVDLFRQFLFEDGALSHVLHTCSLKNPRSIFNQFLFALLNLIAH